MKKKSLILWADRGIFNIRKRRMLSMISVDHDYNHLYRTPFNPYWDGKPYRDFKTREDVIRVKVTIEEVN